MQHHQHQQQHDDRHNHHQNTHDIHMIGEILIEMMLTKGGGGERRRGGRGVEKQGGEIREIPKRNWGGKLSNWPAV